MESEIAKLFLNKWVVLCRIDNGKEIYSKGTITQVGEESLILEFRGNIQAIALDRVKTIREEIRHE